MRSVSPNELSDGDLARRIAASDDAARDATEELYRRFWPRVRSFGLRHLRDDEAARELAQHVLLLTVDKLRNHEVHTPEHIASFILSTARWSVRSERRKVARLETMAPEGPFHNDEHFTDGFVGSVTPEPLVDRTWVRGCLETLAERDRTVIVLSFFQGCTAQEIADATGLTAGNVRVVRHRALGLLRHCLSTDVNPEHADKEDLE